MNVELIYDPDCPNYRAARTELLKAFSEIQMTPHWVEWDRSAPDTPPHARIYGSPTILVNGRDIAKTGPSHGNSCRLYPGEKNGFQGIPTLDAILAAMRMADGQPRPVSRKPWKRLIALVPVIGTAALPKLICPACWPAYAGILSALGLGFINYTPYLLPFSILFVGAVLLSLAYRARTRRGYGPFWLGIIASAVLMTGKFGFDSDPFLYGGLIALIGASVWNAWSRRDRKRECPACIPFNEEGGENHETQKNRRDI